MAEEPRIDDTNPAPLPMVSGVFELKDTEENRKMTDVFNLNEILTMDDDGAAFWDKVDKILKWGGKYKITVEQV